MGCLSILARRYGVLRMAGTIFSKFRNSSFRILNFRKRCGHFRKASFHLAISAIDKRHAALYRFFWGRADDSFDLNDQTIIL
jgi:hypothetical protein